MKKILFILLAIFGTYTITYSSFSVDNANIVTEEATVTDAEMSNNISNHTLIIIDCPDCYGTLQNTYITEYCVGQRCRTRTLYRCNYDRDHEYWIYKD